ncbi:MAG TPA: 3'(2'),5'-bisphosphate nucleotidase CysQ [Methylophilaceae bacterium]|nr:3'(2'),5'-bisphosphate nucleotidase CysQ [Methylophilaceae bacterium]
MTDYQSWLPDVIRIAREAGDAIMEVYRSDIAVVRKQDNSPLTHADIAAHHVIESGLQKLTPHLPQLSEESIAIPYSTRATWRRYWLIDPLDGTREFIKRNGEFSVNIALIDHGKPIMGVVYGPDKEQLYYGCAGLGAFKQEGDGEIQRIHARPLNVNDLTIAGSRSHVSVKTKAFLNKVGGNLSIPKSISLGSSLKICLVAEGLADLYPRLGLTSEWDTAAAQCVLEEAGGLLTDHQGEAFTYNTKDSLLNPEFFARGATPHNWSQYLE